MLGSLTLIQTNSDYDLTLNLLGHVTIEKLLNSGNEKVAHIYAEVEEVQELRKQVMKLETQVEVLKALQKDQPYVAIVLCIYAH
ncbi:hypothetical protein APHAL10511_005798 [Amanita phalloides]|nr:hypothetical protein APHAL10511_005798 [Amanita phalloides]